MKNVYLALATVLAVLTLFLASSCSKNQDCLLEDDLFSEMINYSQHFDPLYIDCNTNLTKSSDFGSFDQNQEYPDINILGENFLKYLDLYTTPDNIDDWDEYQVLKLIAHDSQMNYEEKISFAQSISFAYYIKNKNGYSVTKAPTPEECYENYEKTMKRALRRAVVTLAVGLLEPTVAGEALAIGMYAIESYEAQEDYEDCLAKTLRIPQE